MSAVYDQYVGVADEASYGAGAAPTDFYEIVSESINGSYERIESEAIRGPVLRADRFAPNAKGAAGDFEFEIQDKGFDFWLKHMLGSASTATGVTTATPGALDGKSFALNVGRWAADTNTLVPFAYKGGKVSSWEISAEVDQVVKCKITGDYATEVINGAGTGETAAVPTYPADAQLMTFIGGTCTIGGDAVEVTSVSVTGDNALKTDRYAMRGSNSTTKREPKQNAVREYGFTLGMEFEDDTQVQRVAAASANGTIAEIVLNFDSPQGGTLAITLAAARFDEATVNAGWDVLESSPTGKALAPADGSDAIEIVYTEAAAA